LKLLVAALPVEFMTEFIQWSAPPELLELPDGEVHVWRASLDLDSGWLAELRTSLAPGEIERANRYVFESDRLRYEAGRGILRRLLSRYHNCPPAAFEIHTNPFGKPVVDGDICFNLSHSGPLAVYVFARNSGVGIDLEQIRTDVECVEIAGRYFTGAELGELVATPKETRNEAFFRGWTRKEAYVKALGRGLSTSLSSFEVGITNQDTLLGSDSDNIGWVVKSFVPHQNFVGSVVTSGQESQFSWWEFST
jgi:4'-phosphopantetheinyl transferase